MNARKTESSREKPKKTATIGLTKQRYTALLRDVKELVATAAGAVDQQKVVAQWNLGRRLRRERIRQGAGYHNSVLRDLATDARIALRNLQYAITFHETYATCPKLPLNWLHYRILLNLSDKKLRDHYTAIALQEHLSARELSRLIQSDRRGISPSDEGLPRPEDPNYLYAAQVLQILDGDTLDLSIDLGFHTHHQARFRLAQIDAPELPSNEARAARDFLYKKLIPASTIVVQTHKSDIYGRYLAHVFYSDEELTVAECFARGRHLNAELVEGGFAERVS